MSKTQFRPMLAEEVVPEKLRFPVYVAPKYDGVRAMTPVFPGKTCELISRSLKPIPNEYTRGMFRHLRGLDGELVTGDPFQTNVFNESQSAFMSRDGEPDAGWYLFDCIHPDVIDKPFEKRLHHLYDTKYLFPDNVEVVPHFFIENLDDFWVMEEDFVNQGFEGIVVRDPKAPYKFGRSTIREQYLLRYKRWHTCEAKIVGVKEQMTNTNEAKVNALGLTERSSHKSGMVGKGTLGSFILKADGFTETFDCGMGPGLTDAERARLWSLRDKLPGQLCTIAFQGQRSKDRPSLPKWMGLRSKEDLS